MPAHRPSAAGGLPLAVGAVGGAALGVTLGQPTAYFLAGLALGGAIALLIWWRTK